MNYTTRDGSWLCNDKAEIVGWECPQCGRRIDKPNWTKTLYNLVASLHKCPIGRKDAQT